MRGHFFSFLILYAYIIWSYTFQEDGFYNSYTCTHNYLKFSSSHNRHLMISLSFCFMHLDIYTKISHGEGPIFSSNVYKERK